jgi:hypothetical protein
VNVRSVRLAAAFGLAAAAACAAAATAAVNPKAIPLGDGHVSSSPRTGYVDSCQTQFGGMGGAQAVGPWIDTAAKTWDSWAKIAVGGTVAWPNASWKATVHGKSRVISGNDLPINHTTGTFPVAGSDPAANYDRNPNSIAPQSIAWTVPLNPAAAAKPSCTALGPIGMLTDGVLLYNALDGEGRDAAAHEVLDRCGGHPDMSSSYHHHDVPSCILAKSGPSALVGYAIDGYGIYVERDARGALLTNRDLDACHGRKSRVLWNSKKTAIYHYVATIEYPYTVGCFHGTPAVTTR